MLVGLLSAWALAVAAIDWTQRRIPNLLLLLLAVPAVAVLALNRQGLLGADVAQSLFGLCVGAAPLLAGYLIRQVGAGDVKLAALQGLMLGTAQIAEALLVAAMALGLMSAVALVRIRMGRPLERRLPAAPALVVGFMAIVLEKHLL